MSTDSGPVICTAPAVDAKSVSKHKKTAADRWAAGDDLDFVDSDTDDEHEISHEASQGSFDLASLSLTTIDTRSTVERH
jgi:hypothetical protein